MHFTEDRGSVRQHADKVDRELYEERLLPVSQACRLLLKWLFPNGPFIFEILWELTFLSDETGDKKTANNTVGIRISKSKTELKELKMTLHVLINICF